MVDADPQNSGGEGSSTGGRLHLINLVVLQVVELNRQRAILMSDLAYSSDLTKSSYSAFYRIFMEVYKLTDTLISEDLNKELGNWITATGTRESTATAAELRKRGLDLAEKLVDELSKLGLLQLFEEQVAPPFLFDFDLLAAKDIIASVEAEAKRKAAEAAAAPQPVGAEPVVQQLPPPTPGRVRIRKRKGDR